MAKLAPWIKRLIIAWLLWRLGLWLVAGIADQFLLYQPSFPYADALLANTHLPRWLYSWGNFDGVHYLTIAELGYLGTGSIQAFFPVFPLILKLLAWFSQPLLSGIVFNSLLTLLLLVAFYQLAKLDQTQNKAWWSVLALLAFPTSLFFGALYSESLFLILIIGSFWMARKGRWWLAGSFALLASATRIVGILLVPALLVEFWWQHRGESWKKIITKSFHHLIGILLGCLGLGTYMFYLWKNFGDPLYFFHVQSEFGAGRQESLILLPQVIWRYLKILWTARPFDWKYFSYLQDLLLSLGGLGALLVWWKKIRPSYLVFSLAAFILPTLTGTLSSMPRYLLVCFPLFMLLGEFYQKKLGWSYLLLTVSAILLIINTILFVQGYWVA